MSEDQEAKLRGLVLGFLYANKNHNWAYVKPESFTPEIPKRQISLIGRDFHEAGLIRDFPSDNGDGYFMRITLHGRAVWLGQESSSLEVQLPKAQNDTRVSSLSTPETSSESVARQARERVQRYHEAFQKTLQGYDKERPHWRVEIVFVLIEWALKNLKHSLESTPSSGVTWESPFVEYNYPVEIDWGLWSKGDYTVLAFQSGSITAENTVTEAAAIKTLSQILIRQLTTVVLQELTHEISLEKRGDSYIPIIPPELTIRLSGLRKKEREAVLKELFEPFAIGAASVAIDEKSIGSHRSISKQLANELERTTALIDLPAIDFDAEIEGHQIKISLILQIHPLILEAKSRSSYFPITIGILLQPKEIQNAAEMLVLMNERWCNPACWSSEDRELFWEKLFDCLRSVSKKISEPPPEMASEILTVKATLKTPGDINQIVRSTIDNLLNKGELLEFSHEVIRGGKSHRSDNGLNLAQLAKNVESASGPHSKGRALEELIVALFASVPGLKAESRNVRTETEEIDLVVLNASDDPRLRREEAHILVECKNWTDKCGKNEFVEFEKKIRNRKGRSSLGVLISWNGFAETFTKEMLRSSHERLLIIPLDGSQIADAIQRQDFLAVLISAWDKAINI